MAKTPINYKTLYSQYLVEHLQALTVLAQTIQESVNRLDDCELESVTRILLTKGKETKSVMEAFHTLAKLDCDQPVPKEKKRHESEI